MKIKRILFLTPVVLFALFALSLVLARPHFEQKLNQLVLSTSGDPDWLNPILSAETISGSVCGLVFNGLLKYDENLNLVGDLAESYEISQVSKVYVKGDAAAKLHELEAALARGEFKEHRITGFQLIPFGGIAIRMKSAGRRFESAILKHVPKPSIRPVNSTTVLVDTSYSFPDGTRCKAGAALEKLKAWLPKEAGVLEGWEENSSAFTIRYVGAKQEVERGIKKFFSLDRSKEEVDPRWKSGFGVVVRSERLLFDNSPILTFKLRTGVRWHDGHPFTSADAAFTYEKIMDEQTNTVRRPMFELVKKVETPDPHTFIVTYKKPFSPCLETWTMGVIPKHILVDEDINTAPFNRDPIGTGPFKFEEWRADDKISVVANDDYFRGRPQLDRISWRIIPEPPLRMLEFQVEGVDYDAAQYHEFARMSRDKRFKVFKRPSNGYTYIGWNNRLELFRDKRVRRALTHAINREEIVKYVLYGLGVVATGTFPPEMWYYNPDVKPLPYDPDKARKLLAEAGWKDTDGDGILDKNGEKFSFNLITNNGNQTRKDVAVLVQEQLRNIGIEAEIALYEWSVFLSEKIDKRNFDACVLGWSLSLDPDVYEIWHSSQREKGFNFVGYKNPEVDRLIEDGRTEYDREKRKRIYFRQDSRADRRRSALHLSLRARLSARPAQGKVQAEIPPARWKLSRRGYLHDEERPHVFHRELVPGEHNRGRLSLIPAWRTGGGPRDRL